MSRFEISAVFFLLFMCKIPGQACDHAPTRHFFMRSRPFLMSAMDDA